MTTPYKSKVSIISNLYIEMQGCLGTSYICKSQFTSPS